MRVLSRRHNDVTIPTSFLLSATPAFCHRGPMPLHIYQKFIDAVCAQAVSMGVRKWSFH